MFIEQLADQDLSQLREEVIVAYKYLRSIYTCQCERCKRILDFSFDNWHPEQYENYNDAWKVVSLLEYFGYPSYDWDSVLYTAYIDSHNYGGSSVRVQADGISFPQAVCNLLVKYAKLQRTK